MELNKNIFSPELPKLSFHQGTYLTLLEELMIQGACVVTDDYNYQRYSTLYDCFLVNDNSFEALEKLKSLTKDFTTIVALGGCLALDIGKALSSEKVLFVIPTILSTSCISVNRAVIEKKGDFFSVETKIPKEVFICPKELTSLKSSDLHKWTRSGYGDLFANISASIDYHFSFGLNTLNQQTILKSCKTSMEAAYFVMETDNLYSEDSLSRLAHFLHDSSLSVILRGNTELSGGWEHKLYYEYMKKNRPEMIGHGSGNTPTHGEIVAIGAILNISSFCQYFGNNELLELFQKVYKKLGLPVKSSEMEALGVKMTFIDEVLQSLKEKQLLNGGANLIKQTKNLDYFQNV